MIENSNGIHHICVATRHNETLKTVEPNGRGVGEEEQCRGQGNLSTMYLQVNQGKPHCAMDDT
jgi:hypothetical protein